MRALVTTIVAIGLLAGTAVAQQRPERDSRVKSGDLSQAMSRVGQIPTSAPQIQFQEKGLNGQSSNWSGTCPNFSNFIVVSGSREHCDFRAASMTAGSCPSDQCGVHYYYQHYTVSMPGSAVGSYQETVSYACGPCPIPEQPIGGDYNSGGGSGSSGN